MNLTKLFETQAQLDEHIYEKHPELRDQNNLDWKILALQVELGECANEWRGFKKWSNDQEPRTFVPNINDPCKACEGQGYKDKHLDIKQWIFCKECDGIGVYYHNPLLEEYVDCLHFILSIGVERRWILNEVPLSYSDESIEIQFNEMFLTISHFYINMRLSKYMHVFKVFLSLGRALGFTWEQIEQAYYDKNKINHARQDGGY